MPTRGSLVYSESGCAYHRGRHRHRCERQCPL